ncbi:MAG: methyltransferase domain-containing protein [Anaerovorax sp.]
MWSEPSMEWMEKAEEQTKFFGKIGEILAPYLRNSDMICEIACGTGLLAAALSPLVKAIHAVDISPLALDYMAGHLETKNIKNIRPICGDWKHVSLDKSYHVVIFSYFSALLEDFSLLQQLASRLIIAILPFSNANSRFSKDDDSRNQRETAENAVAFLKQQNIPFQLIERELEFGQPFSSYDEAMDFMTYYYPHYSHGDIQHHLNRFLVGEGASLYLPKKKRVGILIIESPHYSVNFL